MPFESFKNENEGVTPRTVSEAFDATVENELQEALAAIQRGDIVIQRESTPAAKQTEQPLILNAEFPGATETAKKNFTPNRPGDDFRNTLANQAEQNDPKKQFVKLENELRILDSKIAIQKQLMQGRQGNIKTLNQLGEERDRLVEAMNLITKGIKEIPQSGRDATIDAKKDKVDPGFLYQ